MVQQTNLMGPYSVDDSYKSGPKTCILEKPFAFEAKHDMNLSDLKTDIRQFLFPWMTVRGGLDFGVCIMHSLSMLSLAPYPDSKVTNIYLCIYFLTCPLPLKPKYLQNYMAWKELRPKSGTAPIIPFSKFVCLEACVFCIAYTASSDIMKYQCYYGKNR